MVIKIRRRNAQTLVCSQLHRVTTVSKIWHESMKLQVPEDLRLMSTAINKTQIFNDQPQRMSGHQKADGMSLHLGQLHHVYTNCIGPAGTAIVGSDVSVKIIDLIDLLDSAAMVMGGRTGSHSPDKEMQYF